MQFSAQFRFSIHFLYLYSSLQNRIWVDIAGVADNTRNTEDAEFCQSGKQHTGVVVVVVIRSDTKKNQCWNEERKLDTKKDV